MRKRVLHIIVLMVIGVILIISLAFSTGELSKVKCTGVTVLIKDGSPRFLDEEEITNLIKKTDANLLEKKLSDINTNELEEKLSQVGSIRKIEVFRHISGESLNFKGSIIAEVEQRNPIVRVMSGNDDYYLDVEGVKIDQTNKFTAKVLVANGSISQKFAKEELLSIVRFIDENEFWKAQIEQIYVENDGELILVPQVGDQLIEFGNSEDFQKKFRNLKALYQQVFSISGWTHYKNISLKYQNQVVCTKK
ncbi:cell division protein FtsQ/DivIB [Sunxiuqinia sp. A32]|uniref:cell division protein FtsQ/DivIB n=1 Tax=Sunxiuqinia sp. A32 TaxID=3461496 RepID=UPI004045B206